jgi:DNA-binding response OmpR family regulator
LARRHLDAPVTSVQSAGRTDRSVAIPRQALGAPAGHQACLVAALSGARVVAIGWRPGRGQALVEKHRSRVPAGMAEWTRGAQDVKVLVVDDDADLLDLMTYALRREGYSVLTAIDGQQALQRWETEHPDIVLLDGNLPKLDGFEVCRRIRHGAKTPIIMLTARDEEADVLRGLQVGADDYVTKPFSAKLLTARMKTVLRRCQSDPFRQAVSEVRVGDLVLNLQSHEVTKGDKPVQLTPLEFRILYLLAMNSGRVIPYSRLVE